MKPFIIYNWKTYIPSANDSVALAEALTDSDAATVIVCPSALHISAVADILSNKHVSLGAQDISASANQPQTGNLSGEQISRAGASYVIVGHAETRAAGITNDMVAHKVIHARMSHLTPIICLSEQEADTKQHSDEEISEQLKSILSAAGKPLTQESDGTPSCIIAYEPTTHIGADHTLAPELISKAAASLRAILQSHDLPLTPVIYGGAVNPNNMKEVLRHTSIDGFLIGRAGVDAAAANTILSSL